MSRGITLDVVPENRSAAIAIPGLPGLPGLHRPGTPPPNGRTSDTLSASSLSSLSVNTPTPSSSPPLIFAMGTPINSHTPTPTPVARPNTPLISGLNGLMAPPNAKTSANNIVAGDQPATGRLMSPPERRPHTPAGPSFSVSPVSIGSRPNSSGNQSSTPYPETPRAPQTLSERLKTEMAAMRRAKDELSASLPEWEESSSDSEGEEVVSTRNNTNHRRGDSTPGTGSPNAGYSTSLSMPATPLAAGYLSTNTSNIHSSLRPPVASSGALITNGSNGASLRGSPTMSPAKVSPNISPGTTPLQSPAHHHPPSGGLAAALLAAKKIPGPAPPPYPPPSSITQSITPQPVQQQQPTQPPPTIASGTLASPNGAAGLVSTPAKRAGSMMVASFSGSLLGAAPVGGPTTSHHIRRGSTGDGVPEGLSSNSNGTSPQGIRTGSGPNAASQQQAALAHAKMSLRERRAMLMSGGSGSTLAVATQGPQAAAGGLGPIGYDVVASPRGGVVFAGSEAASPRRPAPLLVGEALSPRPGSAHGSAQASPANASLGSASNRARVSRIGSLFMPAGGSLLPGEQGALSMLENHVRGHIKKSIIANDREREVQEALSHLPLEDVIATPQYCEVLERFLVKNFCAENLAFIQHVQMFDKIPVEKPTKRSVITDYIAHYPYSY
jgi:hypothetical protein